MANWDRINKLIGILEEEEEYAQSNMGGRPHFQMPEYIVVDSFKEKEQSKVTAQELKDAPRVCNLAACLAGEAILEWSHPDKIFETNYDGSINSKQAHAEGRALLELTEAEASHMFFGYWFALQYLLSRYVRAKITRKDAIFYLKKVIKNKNVMVNIYE